MMVALLGSDSVHASQVDPTPRYIQLPRKAMLSFWCLPVGMPVMMTRRLKDVYPFEGVSVETWPVDETYRVWPCQASPSGVANPEAIVAAPLFPMARMTPFS